MPTPRVATRGCAAAVLMWQPTGQAKVVVPSSALVPPAGTGVGLQAEYRVTVGDAEEVTQRMEAIIDRVWLGTDPIIATQRDLLPALEDQLLARMSEQQFLVIAENALAGGQSAASASDLKKARSTLRLARRVFCGRKSQAAYASLLLSRPALLHSASVPAEL